MEKNNKMATKEVIIYKGQKYFIQTSGKYYNSRKKYYGTRLLHRRIWIENYGAIPEGYHIHHIDRDWRNNNIGNLKLIEKSEHQKMHCKELFKDEEYVRKNKIAIIKAGKKSKEWHASQEGRKWHSRHGKKTWENREKKYIVKCHTCGKEFKSYFKVTKHCSISCTNKYNRNNCRKVKKNCEYCGKEYFTGSLDIDDPYGSDLSSYRKTFELIKERIDRLIDIIKEEV